MKIQKILIFIVIILSSFSCKKDDPYFKPLMSIDQRNKLDNQAIEQYLKEHYFDKNGKSTKFGTNPNDKNNISLFTLAKQDPSGFWYVKNPKVKTFGNKVKNNNESQILLQYEMSYFVAEKSDDNDKILYYPNILYTTINTTGKPQWNPQFFCSKNQQNRNYYEIPAFVKGIQYFDATNRDIEDKVPVNFQGLIIAPSRTVFGRKSNAIFKNIDVSVIINFELYQVK